MGHVVVTGANGFLGRHICGHLSSQGWQVTAIVRRPEAIGVLPNGIRTKILDLESGKDLTEALRGADAVVHLAALAHVVRDHTHAASHYEYHRVNVALTETVLRASLGVGVRRFLFMSSAKAVGAGTDGSSAVALDEECECLPVDAYGRSKLEAERIVLETGTEHGVQCIVVRPPLVYGAGVKANFLRLIRAVDRGIPLPLGAVANKRSMIYIGNLAHFVHTCLQHPNAGGAAYHVADQEALSTKDLLGAVAKLLGKPLRLLSVPMPLLKLGARVVGHEEDLQRLIASFVLNTDRARRSLGWAPIYTSEQGLRETIRWYWSVGRS
jgi:nucleoside-diphosphate-sugar epimerase